MFLYLQVASCTLDASVKIYSYRVDSVLADTFKVLGGLNRGEAAGMTVWMGVRVSVCCM